MERRSFTTRRRWFVLSAAAGLFVPVNARAQKRRRIGALTATPPDRLAANPGWIALLDGLRTYGWNEGNNLEIIIRASGGDQRKWPVLADELLSAGVELGIAFDTPSAQALFQRTKTVPIIFAGGGDPVAAGLVSSLARPGGNVTGWASDLMPLAGKFIEFSRELVPGLRRLAVMFNPENQASARGYHMFEPLVPAFGFELIPAPVVTSEQLEPALAVLARARPQVLMVQPASPINMHTARIAEFAIRLGIPALAHADSQAREGCLLSYGPDWVGMAGRTAYYVDRILRGAAPSDLPIELAPFRLTINLATARALGLTIPPAILARTDEVIE
ncbi:MAG TPA: ABC transporter substrate-binding protein [Vineibacter sp.]|nr:ABC transporter substrate-binding protein [Vineibacter sp.]